MNDVVKNELFPFLRFLLFSTLLVSSVCFIKHDNIYVKITSVALSILFSYLTFRSLKRFLSINK